MSFSELPTELLSEIASHIEIDDAAMIHLASTSWRFHNSLMPAVIADETAHVRRLMGLRNDNTRCLHLAGVDATGNEISVNQPADSHIEPFGGSYPFVFCKINADAKDLRCIRRIIVRAVELLVVHIQVKNDSNIRTVAAMFNTCIGRPDIRLTISGALPHHTDSGRGPYSFKFQPKNPPSVSSGGQRSIGLFLSTIRDRIRRAISLNRLFLWPKKKLPPNTAELPIEMHYVGTPRVPSLNLSITQTPQLSSLAIEGDILFLPSLYPLTRETLNIAPITSLSLSQITLHLFDWSLILPSITMPLLQDLSITEVQIAWPDLVAFLQRHQSIRALDFGNCSVIGVATFPKNWDLPHLATIGASTEYLVPFLRHQEHGRLFSLRSLSPTLRARYARRLRHPHQSSELYEFASFYSLVFQRSDLLKYKIRLQRLLDSGLVEWMISTSATWSSPHQNYNIEGLAICGEFELFDESTSRLSEWMDQHRLLWTGVKGLDRFAQIDDSEPRVLIKKFLSFALPSLSTFSHTCKTCASAPEGRSRVLH